jgi:flavin reductase (DIM6/NTAB) family NADH-FMN oxidoreductase RutF
MMRDRSYLTDIEQLMTTLKKGAFLTVKAGDSVNTMTIGWATFGYVWKTEVLMVAVRDSRYTFELIEKADNFTVSIPTDQSVKDAVMFCGTKSGRDHDKFRECGLGKLEAKRVDAPVIDIPAVHYECQIIYKSAMDSSFLDPEFATLYPRKDYHTLYFGKILDCYETT